MDNLYSATLSTIHYDLSEHDYVETTAPGWLDLTMVRRPPHELIHKVAGVLEIDEENADLPSVEDFCAKFYRWSLPLRGQNGLALFIFAYPDPGHGLVHATLEAGRDWEHCPVVRIVYGAHQKVYWYMQSMQGVLMSHKVPA
jgi:hypothetical protein